LNTVLEHAKAKRAQIRLASVRCGGNASITLAAAPALVDKQRPLLLDNPGIR
jgi:hypothetical protein